MKKTVFLVMIIMICLSCKNKPTSFHPLLIKTVDVTGVDENQIKEETISQVTDEYFECEMSAQTNGGYHVQKDLIVPSSKDNFRFVFYSIVDNSGEPIHFMTSAELLNYMVARGYEMVLEIPGEYGNSYRFKKK